MATTLTQDEIKSFKGRGWLLNKGTDTFSARVVTVNGKVSVDQLLAVAEAARKFGSGEVTFTSRQGIEVLGVPAGKTADFENALAAAGLSVGGTGPRVRPVMSCKGTVCPRGLIDTFSLSQKIHERFYMPEQLRQAEPQRHRRVGDRPSRRQARLQDHPRRALGTHRRRRRSRPLRP